MQFDIKILAVQNCVQMMLLRLLFYKFLVFQITNDFRKLLDLRPCQIDFVAPILVPHRCIDGLRIVDQQIGCNLIGGGTLIFRIGQEADRDCDTGDDSHHNDPEGGLFIVQHGCNPAFYINLTEGKGAGGDHVPGNAAFQQRHGVGFSSVHIQRLYNFFIAGLLDIPAQQNVGQP